LNHDGETAWPNAGTGRWARSGRHRTPGGSRNRRNNHGQEESVLINRYVRNWRLMSALLPKAAVYGTVDRRLKSAKGGHPSVPDAGALPRAVGRQRPSEQSVATAVFRDQHGGALLPGSAALGEFDAERPGLADQVTEDDCTVAGHHKWSRNPLQQPAHSEQREHPLEDRRKTDQHD
jgi:hypothetical protein